MGHFIVGMDWSDKYLAELKKTILLKNNCLELREEFDEYQSERLAIICKKYLPKYRNNSRDIPSKKVSALTEMNVLLPSCWVLCLRQAIK